MSLTFAPATPEALALHVIEAAALDGWLADQPAQVAAWVRAAGFSGALGKHLLVPGADGKPAFVLAGYGSAAQRARGRFHLAGVAANLPAGSYRMASGLPGDQAAQEALGWLLSGYAFDRYRSQNRNPARLVAPEGVDAARLEVIAAGEALTRDLINTPANDMGPDALEAACLDLAARHGARTQVIRGAALLEQNFDFDLLTRAPAAPGSLVE
ncbi:MAG: leucyl aminopeptidase family protein, partial [Paracoccaceae bacterium]|nr:leucyl aminopeptidase family protein [Paracoccaceae bacterium]